jgi:hypothetical protein
VSLDEAFTFSLPAEFLCQLTGFEFAVFVENGALAQAIAEDASIQARNPLHGLVACQVTLLELAAGVEAHLCAFARTQLTAPHAGHAQNRRIVGQLNKSGSAVGI